MIELDHVTVAFGRTVALRDLTLVLQPGITGLFGSNAAGKSTLLRTIAGFISPTRGELRVTGAPSRESLRQILGWVGHESGLYGRLTLWENLELFATLHGAPQARAKAAVESLALEGYAAARVEDLSAGTKRRAAVARALLADPRILLLDEPYANLDDDAANLVSHAIREWSRRDENRCAVVASHGAKRVKAYATASLILQRGRAVSYRIGMPGGSS